jgi:excisionase family DNA binding protein
VEDAMTTASVEEWITLSQAARVLACSPQTVRLMADRGTVRTWRTGLGRLVAAADIARLARERETRQAGVAI